MNTTYEHNERIAKVEIKGRTKSELYQVIEWLTGYDNEKLK